MDQTFILGFNGNKHYSMHSKGNKDSITYIVISHDVPHTLRR